MYKLDRSYSKIQTFDDAEKDNVFLKSDPLSERLNQAWYLTAMAFGISVYHPPKMEKCLVSIRKHSK